MSSALYPVFRDRRPRSGQIASAMVSDSFDSFAYHQTNQLISWSELQVN